MHTHPRHPRPLVFDLLLAITLILTILLNSQVSASAAPSLVPVTGQASDTLLTSGDLGIAERLVTDTTIITTLDGNVSTGVDGLQSSIASLEANYPGALFESTRTHSVNSLIIVDWNATMDGTVVLPGRTLVTIENGAIAKIRFLNLNAVAPASGATFI